MKLASLAFLMPLATALTALAGPKDLNSINGAYYLPSEQQISADLIERRAAIVTELENSRRIKSGLPLLTPFAKVIPHFAAYEGPTLLTQDSNDKLNLVGGPDLHVGSNFVLPEPTLARYNTKTLVYLFESEKVVSTIPFREFAVSKLPGRTIKLTRIFFSENSSEANIWRNRDWKKLMAPRTDANGDVAASYRHLNGRPLHFGVGGLWAPILDKPRIEIEVSKELLLDLAKRGQIEIGLTGPNEIPPEIIILESAWPLLIQQPMQFIEPML